MKKNKVRVVYSESVFKCIIQNIHDRVARIQRFI